MRTRDVVSRAREVMGGNGILLNMMLPALLQMLKRFILMKEQRKLTHSLSAGRLRALVRLYNILIKKYHI
jgi:hypothetical protein